MRIPILLLACLAAALALSAQVTFGAQSSATGVLSSGAPTTVLAHTTANTNNRILLVSVHLGIKSATGTSVSGVTYGGQALTRVSAINDGSSDVRTEVWYLLNPPAGANNVIVTATGFGGGSAGVLVGATTFSGVNQVAPAANAAEGHGSTTGVTVAGTATNDVVIDFVTTREDATAAATAPQTAGYNATSGASNEHVRAATSRRAGAAGTTGMSWSLSKVRRWAQIGVRLQAARADVGLTMTATDPGPDLTFSQGESVTYTITVTNNGPSRATNVVVTDTLPAGIAFNSVSPGAPTCSHAGGTVTCVYATLNAAASNVININGTITTNTTQITNTATVTRNEIDPNPANDSASSTITVVAPTVVHMLEMEAVQDAKGKVAITWTTSFEAENLGFNLYRESGGTREKLNKQLIAGSALFWKHDELSSGRSYRWGDKVKGHALAQYYLEDVDLHGVKTMHGPITPVLVGEVPEAANTDTIAELGSAGGVFVSPRGIGAPRVATATPTRAQREQQWDLASQAAAKLMVTREGWYRVRFAELIAAGFAPGKRLALFSEGIEQPLHVTGDAVEFYGIGIDTPAAGARAYWLVNDKGRATRIRKEKPKKGAEEATRTPFTFERIERSIFFTGLTGNGERENFFGPIVSAAAAATQEVTVENLDRGGGEAALEVVLQGVTGSAHAVQVTVNGQAVATVQYTGMGRKKSSIALPLAMLADGANAIGFRALNGDLDVSLLESVRLTYPHRLVADEDALKVAANGGTVVAVAGFTSASVRAIDVTDPAEPFELEVELASGTATVTAPESGMRSILLIGESRVAAPAQVVASRPSTWSATTNAADLLIVSARAFAPAAEMLKARREADGLATAIVDVQDIYDELGFGQRSPQAIRELLLRSQEWARAPKYVVLLGDASFDPRNYLGLGAFDYVPTKLVDTTGLKTASDDWFADFAGDGVPHLAIGRLPARTLAQAEAMVRKLVERDSSASDRVAFVADPSRTFDFAGAAASLAALAPPSTTTSVAARADAAAFDSLLLTYLGHGSVDVWSAGRFRGSAAASLTNRSKPIVAALTCLNGYYHDMFMSSLAETLMLNPNGGAVAVWASSALTEPDPQVQMSEELFRQLFAGARLGDAVIRAKAATANGDVRRSWILFGDPSMTLR